MKCFAGRFCGGPKLLQNLLKLLIEELPISSLWRAMLRMLKQSAASFRSLAATSEIIERDGTKFGGNPFGSAPFSPPFILSKV